MDDFTKKMSNIILGIYIFLTVLMLVNITISIISTTTLGLVMTSICCVNAVTA